MHPSPEPLPSKIISMKRLYIASLLGALVLYSCMVELAICSSNFTDQLALFSFKSHITQDPNIKLGNWTTETNFCDWEGVSCSRRRQRVTALSLGNMGLAGSISPYIGNLSFLKVLDLGNNSFDGPLINEIGRLHRLTDLILHKNNLQGGIPLDLYQCRKLQVIVLAVNNFTGGIPAELSSLSFLRTLLLEKNNLTGRIPPSFGNISSLESFGLGGNNIHGSIPIELAQLPNLKAFDLTSNHLTGPVPSSIYNHSSLWYLSLADNQLTGPIQEFTNSILDVIDLSENDLHGPIPPLSTAHSFISHNKFTGEIPLAICNMSSPIILDLSHNSLNGVIPECFGNFSNVLRVLDLGMNNFRGNIPVTIAKRNKLKNFPANSLEVLNLSHNNLSGVIPDCLGNFSNALMVLNLGMNNFHGKIPTIFAEGNQLRNIDLNGNQLEGPVPRSLVNCTHLEVLDLGNNIIDDTFPYWLETLPMLQALVLQSNKFHSPLGTFKTKFPFPKLRIFDLSHNEFCGLLPTKYFEHFKAMRNVNEKVRRRYMGDHYYKYSVTVVVKGLKVELVRILTIFTIIDLSNNKFTGEIPNVIGNLNSLRLLNLSHNDLTGNIPSLLGNLLFLESLDLSSNQLVGEIPNQLTTLTFLAVLNLSQNHLEGRIPQGNQFNTFQNNSYDGNLALCGFPLSNKCGDNGTPQLQPPPMSHPEDDPTFFSGFNLKVVFIGYGCGMIFGLLMGYLMFLIGKPKWFVRIVEGERHKKGKRC
ncbi:unnamed protein product [Camellia sinensis]